jgi:hypothetical protein
MNQDVFERYLQYRFQRAGAVTAGQRLEVLQQIKEEARKGMVPLDESSVATLDLNDPAVQAVLRGESVSMGGQTLKKKSPMFAMPKASESRSKVLILVTILLIPILGAILFLSARKASRVAALEAAYTATPLPTMTAAPSMEVVVSPTVEIPTEVPTNTPPSNQVLYSSGKAADEPTSPASIEIAGRRFVVLEGEVDGKSGVWQPSGVEWLRGTVVRKVFAIPQEMIEGISLTSGDPIQVRYRNGYTVTYALTQSTQVIVDQIELLRSNKPSIVILVYTGNLEDPYRTLLVGEVPVPTTSMQAAPTATAMIGQRAIVLSDGARLRSAPSLKGSVIGGLSMGQEIFIISLAKTVEADGVIWVYVQTAIGNGWIANDLVIPIY